jgi:hypothetical protein
MKPKKQKKNGTSFVLLAIIIIAVVAIFAFFIYRFLQYDKTEFEVKAGSVVYNEDNEYIKVEGDAYLTQKVDRNYYLYEEVDGDTTKHKIGKNAVIHKEGDMYLYLYGTAYQVLSTGDVEVVKGETKVVKSSPTKFFKLDDRQYLMVDPELRTVDSEILDTKDYVIINMDKQGNPSFSNHLVNFKTISQLILTGSTFKFDIALEKLIYEDTEVNLKNIIGSSNQYVEPEPEEEEKEDLTDDKLQAVQDNIGQSMDTVVGYYDKYFNDVIKSVNNLTTSVVGSNNNAILALNKNDVYYDFVKWLALKSIKTGVSTIQVEYTIFDPSDEYQVVHLVVDGPAQPGLDGVDPDKTVHALNKNDYVYTVRDLKPNTSYTIDLTYYKVGTSEETVEDTLVVTTKKDSYNIQVYKITKERVAGDDGEPTDQYILHYELTVDNEYKFTSANIQFLGYTYSEEYERWVQNNSSPATQLTDSNIDNSGIYYGSIALNKGYSLSDKNVVQLDNIKFCNGYTDSNITSCPTSDMVVSYKFFNE